MVVVTPCCCSSGRQAGASIIHPGATYGARLGTHYVASMPSPSRRAAVHVAVSISAGAGSNCMRPSTAILAASDWMTVVMSSMSVDRLRCMKILASIHFIPEWITTSIGRMATSTWVHRSEDIGLFTIRHDKLYRDNTRGGKIPGFNPQGMTENGARDSEQPFPRHETRGHRHNFRCSSRSHSASRTPSQLGQVLILSSNPWVIGVTTSASSEIWPHRDCQA